LVSIATTTPAVAGKVCSANSCRRHHPLILGDEAVGVVLAPALGVHRDALLAVHPAQLALEAPLQAAPADVVAEQVRALRAAGAPELLVELLLLLGADLVHVADEVPAQPGVAVVAVRRGLHVHAGQVHLVGEVAIELLARDVDLEREGAEPLEAAHRLELPPRPLHLLGRELQHRGRLVHDLAAASRAEVGRERDVVGGARVHQHAPVPVEDQPAIGGDPDLLHEVLVGALLVLVAAEDLQLVEAAEQHQEGERDDPRRPRQAGAELLLRGAWRAGREDGHG
jgi:hypothetical protein